MKKATVTLLSFGILFFSSCQSKNQEKHLNFDCPKEDKIVETIKKFIPKSEITIEKVEKFRNLNLCQVEFRIGIKPAVFYINEDISLIFPSVIDGKTGESISSKLNSERNYVPEKLLKQFENYVSYTVGKGDRFVYFIMDPDCEKCIDTYKILEPWASQKNVKIKVIVRPYMTHLNSYNISLSVFCDKKGFKELLEGYDSKRSCDEGIKKLNSTIEFIDEKMAMSDLENPVIISDKGKMIATNVKKEDLDWLLQ